MNRNTGLHLYWSSIYRKINIFFVLIILLYVGFSLYNYTTFRRFSETYNQNNQIYYDSMDLKNYIVLCDASVEEFLRNGNRANLAEHNDSVTLFEQTLQRLNTSRMDTASLSLLRSINDSFYSYQRYCNYAIKSHHSGNYAYFAERSRAMNISQYIRKYCDDLVGLTLTANKDSYALMRAQQQRWLGFNLAALLGMVVVFGTSLGYINANFTKPINDLYLTATEIAEGNLDVSVRENYTEKTMQVLAQAFNTMTGRIRRTMEDLQEKARVESELLGEQLKSARYEQLWQQAHFNALQARMNPHFLFNTLNSISRTITLGQSDDAVAMIDSMSALLRYSLSDDDHPVPLGEELRVVQEYLNIQKQRFRERVSFAIHLDEGLEEWVLLPRFTLQPLVENATMHGLEPLPQGGHIEISARQQKDGYVITVADNGVGMSPALLERVLQQVPDRKQSRTSIGISNTMERLQLFAGGGDVLQIESEEGGGTVATIRLPLRKEERDVSDFTGG